jgi:hypothetical protein
VILPVKNANFAMERHNLNSVSGDFSLILTSSVWLKNMMFALYFQETIWKNATFADESLKNVWYWLDCILGY